MDDTTETGFSLIVTHSNMSLLSFIFEAELQAGSTFLMLSFDLNATQQSSVHYCLSSSTHVTNMQAYRVIKWVLEPDLYYNFKADQY